MKLKTDRPYHVTITCSCGHVEIFTTFGRAANRETIAYMEKHPCLKCDRAKDEP